MALHAIVRSLLTNQIHHVLNVPQIALIATTQAVQYVLLGFIQKMKAVLNVW